MRGFYDTVIYGNNKDNRIATYGYENVTVYALKGDDVIYEDYRTAEPSDDFYFGGKGKDVIHSLFGDDYLSGGDNNDWLLVDAHEGRTVLDGGAGYDKARLFLFDEAEVTFRETKWATIVEQGDITVVIKNNVEHFEMMNF